VSESESESALEDEAAAAAAAVAAEFEAEKTIKKAEAAALDRTAAGPCCSWLYLML
jgi:hypothetical protein